MPEFPLIRYDFGTDSFSRLPLAACELMSERIVNTNSSGYRRLIIPIFEDRFLTTSAAPPNAFCAEHPWLPRQLEVWG